MGKDKKHKKDKRAKYEGKIAKLVRKRGKGVELIVCTDTRKGGCAERGAGAVWAALQQALVRVGAEAEVALRPCEHFGPCKLGPNVVVAPAGEWYSHVSPDDVPAIVQALLDGADATPMLVEVVA
jgi:(2Fe-2S) ferredoxin